MARLTTVPSPRITIGERPEPTPPETYIGRIADAQRLLAEERLDALVVYGDRETFGDLCHLTGMDPRFEEAVFVLPRDGRGTLLLGNENLRQEPASLLDIDIVLWQALSPAGQVRDRPVALSAILGGAGIEAGLSVGVAGGKQMVPGFAEDLEHAISAPAYLVDALRRLVGSTGDVVNAERLFTDPATGMRTTSTAAEIVQFEFAASVAAASVARAMAAIRVGSREDAIADELRDAGLPRSCHAMMQFGPRQGLYSATARRAELGDAFTIAFGLRGGLTCRAGAVAASSADLSEEHARTYEPLALNYFDVVSTWYERVAVGTTTGSVFGAVDAVRDPDVFEFALNPGHHLHLEEWVHSGFEAGSTVPLRSGSLLQCDVIPVVPRGNQYVNIEDGIVLADDALRAELADDHPELWARIGARRDYLREHIGVDLQESVLPLSDTTLWHTPYALDPARALTR